MNSLPDPAEPTTDLRFVLVTAARLTWQMARLPLLALLTLLEPAVRAVLGVAMLLGITAACVFELSDVGPRFSFQGILAQSLGPGLALFAYYGLLALVSR